MPIRISVSLRRELPDEQRTGIAEWLKAKSGGKCHLCGEDFNWERDQIEADHDEPRSADGATDRSNLWLAHAACNRVKRDHPSLDMRPFLRLRAFMGRQESDVRYGDCLPLFRIAPKLTT